MVAGANELDYHYRNVTPGRDFTPTVTADIRNAVEGEGCPNCGAPLKIGKAVEIGQHLQARLPLLGVDGRPAS